MKIDLHCHTKRIKSGDGSGRNVTKELFCKKIFDADVKIVAITNHNAFDKEQFFEFKDAISENCQLWPGVEIDIQQYGRSRWHLIVIANPDNTDIFSDCLNKLSLNQTKNIRLRTAKRAFCYSNELYPKMPMPTF